MQDGSTGRPPLMGAELLDHALQVFDAAAADVAAALEAMRGQGAEGSGRTLLAVRDLQAALAVLMDERVKVDRLRNQVAGVVGERALDLDAARAEIGRRLARLRDAGGGD
ncbi:hypothetical protein G5V65_08245 [Rhodobacter sp. HX-7-19]|uniref:Uncharacterized protein n=1 Tax=Paragemmobacter kunshanensis TaxID=2583234 RepID=A0A6M1TSV8_9RHOB|nr:hypothetical protein [Rhodobacter kunshanensis]NGQ90887.1 hypothetical protein [Rhodobacter kunshanensis]